MAAGWWYPLANSTCNFLPRSRRLPNFYDGKCTDLLPANHAAQASNNFVLGNDRSHFLRDQIDAMLALGNLTNHEVSRRKVFKKVQWEITTGPCNGDGEGCKETVVGHFWRLMTARESAILSHLLSFAPTTFWPAAKKQNCKNCRCSVKFLWRSQIWWNKCLTNINQLKLFLTH